MITGERRQATWLTLAVAGIALSQYAVVWLPWETGMRLQAALIVAALAVVAATAHGGFADGLRRLPPAVRAGLALWAGAASWGAVVGAFSGNPARNVLSQLLAMLLLPAAAWAFARHRRFDADTLTAGLAAAALAALAIHLTVLAWPAAREALGAASDELRLRYSVSYASLGVLTTLCCAAWLSRRRSWLASAGTAAAALLVAGSMARGAWLVVAGGLALLAVLLVRRRRQRTVLAAAAGALLVALAVAVLVATASVREVARLDFEDGGAPQALNVTVVPAGHASECALQLAVSGKRGGARLLDLPLADAASIEVSAWVTGPAGGEAVLWLDAYDAAGNSSAKRRKNIRNVAGYTDSTALMHWPRGATRLVVGLQASSGLWLVDDLVVRAAPTTLAAAASRMRRRSLGLVAVAQDPAGDENLRYRLDELRGVMSRWSRASVPRLLAGHGLGAQFPFVNTTWRDDGKPGSAPVSSYIHNLYVFLGFKLGLAGIGALVGVLLLAGASWRELTHGAAGERRWVHAASLAVWVGYLVLGVTSPEIVSFRCAPLLGALVAAAWGPGAAGGPSVPATGTAPPPAATSA